MWRWWFISLIALICQLLTAAARMSGQEIFRELPPGASGIKWVHDNGKSPHRYLPEMAGPGVAIFDFDNDGWMDILLVNSGPSSFYKPAVPLYPALYRNNHDGTFTDVAQPAGLTTQIFGMGVAIGDYDGDGFPDIFITGIGRCVLYHNNRNGTFSDVTKASGIAASGWSTSAVWFDFDNDGKLDLFIGEFADYSQNKVCSLAESYGGGAGSANAQSYYCHPKLLKPASSRLYRNAGNGRFVDVSRTTGVSLPGKTWGAVATDINGDGFLDLFVSNDTVANFLWLNHRGRTFEEEGLWSTVALSGDGSPRSGMGVDAGDFDRDQRQDLVVGNIDAETASLYRNLGNGVFDDINTRSGIGQDTRMLSTWGIKFIDYDNDGWLDLVLANGHPDDTADQRQNGIHYRQPLLLLHNVAGKRIENVSNQAGLAFQKTYAARGLAIGDLNNDGYPDVVFTENGGPPHVLVNAAESGNNWLGLTLDSRRANPAAAGAVIRWSIGGKKFARFKSAGGSFLSSHDPREVLGAGKNTIDWVEVQWPRPSDRIDRIVGPEMNRYITIVEGGSADSRSY
jgi:hypothetical protein